MESIYFDIERSDGARMAFGDGTEWIVDMGQLDGWLGVDSTVTTSQNANADGSMLTYKRIPDRDRTIRAVHHGSDHRRARNRAVAFFNPKHSFVVHCTYQGRTRWCEGEQLKFECNMLREDTPVILTWSLLCPIPWMQDEDGHERMFGDAEPAFGWPYVSHVRERTEYGIKPVGFVTSKLVFDGVNTINNSGDAETGYKVIMRADGHIERPMVIKDDKFVSVNTVLEAGDVLVLDFESRPPKVTLNGQNIINQCDRESSFTGMMMQVGANRFSVAMDNENNRSLLKTQVTYHSKHLGV